MIYNMKITSIIYLSVIILFSCSNSTKKDDDTNPALISWKSEFVMGDGEQATGYYENRDVFIKPYVSKSYSGDTLRAETLKEINSCGKTIGNIKFSNDTLYLKAKLVSDEFCSSVEFHKFKYTIVKKDIKTYTIVF